MKGEDEDGNEHGYPKLTLHFVLSREHSAFGLKTATVGPIGRDTRYAKFFGKALDRDETTHAHNVCISFFERRSRPSTFGLFRSEEKVVWERWIIPLLVHARGDADVERQADRAQRSRALEETSPLSDRVHPHDGLWAQGAHSASRRAWQRHAVV